jgi:TRAP-type C4-dicarboxylate transport system permease large subunit
MLMVLTTGVMVFVPFLAVSQLGPKLIELISGFPGGSWGVMAAIMVMYLILGMFMSAFEQIFITVPILFPVVLALGFDPIWFGVILCLLCGIGNLTPPYGVIVFVINGLAPDIGMWKIFRGCVPFLFANILGLVLLSVFPEIALWLVYAMKPGL